MCSDIIFAQASGVSLIKMVSFSIAVTDQMGLDYFLRPKGILDSLSNLGEITILNFGLKHNEADTGLPSRFI